VVKRRPQANASSALPQAMAIYDMGPWTTAAEGAIVQRLGAQIGWHAGEFAGVITHGASLANLTGLLTSRNLTLDDSWEQGLPADGLRPVLLAHRDAHYSVSGCLPASSSTSTKRR
jgi:L-2,4-diaminobutyrate decarboxylase